MASRTKQKEEARARRVAEERARAERAARQRRLRIVGGVALIAIVIVAVAIAVSSSGGGSGSASAASLTSAAAKQSAAQVTSALSGIAQSGNNSLGSGSAKVTVTEFGDLECPICRDFAAGAGSQLIANDVRSGKVKLIYRSLPTATGSAPDGATIFPVQQAAALAAGEQARGWNYILTFYKLQGQEGTVPSWPWSL